MKTIHSTYFAATLAVALAFTLSCSGSDDGGGNDPGSSSGSGVGGGGNAFSGNTQLYYENGSEYKSSGVVKISLKGTNLLNAGSVTNGIFKPEMPETISDEYLCTPEATNGCLYRFRYSVNEIENEGCNISPADVKIFVTEGFRLYNSNEERIGTIRYGDGYKDTDGNEYFAMSMYSTKAVKVTCDNIYKKFDIDAKAGWNIVYVKDPDSPSCRGSNPNGKEICKAILSTNNFFTKEVKWIGKDYQAND